MDRNTSSSAPGAPNSESTPLLAPGHTNGNGHSNFNGNRTAEIREPILTRNLDCYKRYESAEHPGLYQYSIDTENELEPITDQPTLDALTEIGNLAVYIHKLMALYTFYLSWEEFWPATHILDRVKEGNDRRQPALRGHAAVLNSLIKVMHGIDIPDTYVMPPPDNLDRWADLLGEAIMKFKYAARQLNSKFKISEFFGAVEAHSRSGSSDELAARDLALRTIQLRYLTHPSTTEGEEEIEEAMDGPWPPLA